MRDPAKKALRKSIGAALSALSPPELVAQSAACLAHLRELPAFTTCRSASIYLPMDGGCEVDTYPILAELLSRGARVAIPRVTGPQPEDMRMLRVASLEQAKSLPRTKWGIPEPDDTIAATMEDATEATDLTLLLVPGMGFDAKCGRLGHGRGYYDCFISRQRTLPRPRSEQLVVVGLCLAPQLVEEVPMGELDQRLDYVVTPDGPLAYTSASDQAKAAAMMGKKRAAEDDPASTASADDETSFESSTSDGSLGVEQRVELANGKYKYACLRLTSWDDPKAGSMLAVRSAPGAYHADVAEPSIEVFEVISPCAAPCTATPRISESPVRSRLLCMRACADLRGCLRARA